MNCRTFAVLAAFASLPLSASEGPLPEKAQELLSKLKAWERQQDEELLSRKVKMRAQVSERLSLLLQQETKAGNLNGAVAIRDAITQLKEQGAGDLQADTPEGSAEDGAAFPDPKRPARAPKDAKYFDGAYYALIGTENISFEEAEKRAAKLRGEICHITAIEGPLVDLIKSLNPDHTRDVWLLCDYSDEKKKVRSVLGYPGKNIYEARSDGSLGFICRWAVGSN